MCVFKICYWFWKSFIVILYSIFLIASKVVVKLWFFKREYSLWLSFFGFMVNNYIKCNFKTEFYLNYLAVPSSFLLLSLFCNVTPMLSVAAINCLPLIVYFKAVYLIYRLVKGDSCPTSRIIMIYVLKKCVTFHCFVILILFIYVVLV